MMSTSTTEEPLLPPGQLARTAGFDQLPHQSGGTGEEHPTSLLRRFHTEGDRKVRFAGPDRASEDQISLAP